MFQQSHHSPFSAPADESRGNLNHPSGSRPSNGLLYHGLLTVNPSSRVTKQPKPNSIEHHETQRASSDAGIGRASEKSLFLEMGTLRLAGLFESILTRFISMRDWHNLVSRWSIRRESTPPPELDCVVAEKLGVEEITYWKWETFLQDSVVPFGGESGHVLTENWE